MLTLGDLDNFKLSRRSAVGSTLGLPIPSLFAILENGFFNVEAIPVDDLVFVLFPEKDSGIFLLAVGAVELLIHVLGIFLAEVFAADGTFLDDF